MASASHGQPSSWVAGQPNDPDPSLLHHAQNSTDASYSRGIERPENAKSSHATVYKVPSTHDIHEDWDPKFQAVTKCDFCHCRNNKSSGVMQMCRTCKLSVCLECCQEKHDAASQRLDVLRRNGQLEYLTDAQLRWCHYAVQANHTLHPATVSWKAPRKEGKTSVNRKRVQRGGRGAGRGRGTRRRRKGKQPQTASQVVTSSETEDASSTETEDPKDDSDMDDDVVKISPPTLRSGRATKEAHVANATSPDLESMAEAASALTSVKWHESQRAKLEVAPARSDDSHPPRQAPRMPTATHSQIYPPNGLTLPSVRSIYPGWEDDRAMVAGHPQRKMADELLEIRKKTSTQPLASQRLHQDSHHGLYQDHHQNPHRGPHQRLHQNHRQGLHQGLQDHQAHQPGESSGRNNGLPYADPSPASRAMTTRAYSPANSQPQDATTPMRSSVQPYQSAIQRPMPGLPTQLACSSRDVRYDRSSYARYSPYPHPTAEHGRVTSQIRSQNLQQPYHTSSHTRGAHHTATNFERGTPAESSTQLSDSAMRVSSPTPSLFSSGIPRAVDIPYMANAMQGVAARAQRANPASSLDEQLARELSRLWVEICPASLQPESIAEVFHVFLSATCMAMLQLGIRGNSFAHQWLRTTRQRLADAGVPVRREG